MAKKKAVNKTPRTKQPAKTRAEKLLESVQGNDSRRTPTDKAWEPNEIQWSWYILWATRQHSVLQIARMAGKHHKTVGDMIKKVQEWEWDALTEERVAIAKRQTRTLEVTFQEAAKGWERSQENAVTIKTEEISIRGMSSDGDMIEVPGIKETRTEAGQAGDASFLNAQMAALKGIRDIWGVEAPKKVESTNIFQDLMPIGESHEETVAAQLRASLAAMEARGIGNAKEKPANATGHKELDTLPSNKAMRGQRPAPKS